MNPQHAGARAAWRDDIVEPIEQIDDLLCDGDRRLTVARVVGGLAAASLGPRRFDDATGIFQQLGGGQTDGGSEEIDETGNEQPDADRQAAIP